MDFQVIQIQQFFQSQRKEEQKSQNMFTDLTPYLYSILGSVCFIIMQTCFKMLTGVFPHIIVTSVQVFFQLFLNSTLLVLNEKYQETYAKYEQFSDGSNMNEVQNDKRFEIHISDPKVFKLILKRLAINCLGVYLFNVGLQYVPLSIANSLFNTGPIMIFFIEAYFYKKPLSTTHLILTLVSFIGVIIIVNPFKAINQENLTECLTMLIPLLTAVVSSFGFIFLHQLKGKLHPLIMMEYSYISLVLYYNFLLNFAVDDVVVSKESNQHPHYFEASITDPLCLLAFTLNVVCAYLMNYCRVKSLFMLPPSKIIPFNYVGIILSLFVDVMIFCHQTNVFEVSGIILTSVGLLSNLLLDLSEKKEIQEDKIKEELIELSDLQTKSSSLNPQQDERKAKM